MREALEGREQVGIVYFLDEHPLAANAHQALGCGHGVRLRRTERPNGSGLARFRQRRAAKGEGAADREPAVGEDEDVVHQAGRKERGPVFEWHGALVHRGPHLQAAGCARQPEGLRGRRGFFDDEVLLEAVFRPDQHQVRVQAREHVGKHEHVGRVKQALGVLDRTDPGDLARDRIGVKEPYWVGLKNLARRSSQGNGAWAGNVPAE